MEAIAIQRVTSHDVARRAGVSRSIVSAVLNNTPGIGVSEQKRKLVLKTIEELNYQVDAHARGMRTGRSHCLAACDNFGNRFFMQILQGVKEICAQTGYHVLLYGSDASERDRNGLLDLYSQRRIDGILTKDSTSFADLSWIEEIRRHGIPYISVEGYPEHEHVPSVQMDYGQSIVLAMDYLRSREIPPPIYVEVYSTPEYNPNWGDRQRRRAYESWMDSHGYVPSVVVQRVDTSEALSDWWIEWIGSLPLPATLLVNWSKGARHVYRAAFRLGLRIGSDLFVMAADNTEQTNEFLTPSLTSVEVPYAEMGALAASALIDAVEGNKSMNDVGKRYVEPKLVIRESV